MRRNLPEYSVPARIPGPAFFLAALCLLIVAGLSAPAQAASVSDHQAAIATLADLQAAIAQLVEADQSYATDRNVYHRASQRAINALEGEHGQHYVAAVGNPGDATGAIGHIDALLDRKDTPVWVPPLHGAEANMRAAVAHLLDANHSRELMDYAIATSRALTYLEVARGRPSETGVLGGIEGALATTVLGIPPGATQVDGCVGPSTAPAYGVHDGYIAWITVPATEGTHALAENAAATAIIVRNGMIALPTAAQPLVTKACERHTEAAPSSSAPKLATAAADPRPKPEPAAASQPPALYTLAQAKAGEAVFEAQCVACHGTNLQGTAAPSVAGTDFLTTAEKDQWSLAIIRYLVFTNMPKSAPGSLSPTQYTDVLAFLLASNCYPAGNTPLPQTAGPDEAKLILAPVPGPHPKENKFGVCPLG